MNRYIAKRAIFHWGVWDQGDRKWIKQNMTEVAAKKLALMMNNR